MDHRQDVDMEDEFVKENIRQAKIGLGKLSLCQRANELIREEASQQVRSVQKGVGTALENAITGAWGRGAIDIGKSNSPLTKFIIVRTMMTDDRIGDP
jgi:hypothetical protein